jgi:hypothetical protein
MEDVLYIMGHDKKYYCKACFGRIARNWPKSGRRAVVIPVDAEEYAAAKRAGSLVEDRFRGEGKKRHKDDFDTSFDAGASNREVSILGEIVMARKTGGRRVHPMEQAGEIRRGVTDGGVDIRLQDGRGLGVKTRRGDGTYDMAETAGTKEILWDACVLLVLGSDGQLTMRGWHHDKSKASMIRFSGDKFRLGIRGDQLLAPALFEEWVHGQGRVQEVQSDDHVRDGND